LRPAFLCRYGSVTGDSVGACVGKKTGKQTRPRRAPIPESGGFPPVNPDKNRLSPYFKGGLRHRHSGVWFKRHILDNNALGLGRFVDTKGVFGAFTFQAVSFLGGGGT